ncbi:MAG: hypothetical protein CMD25_01650 [Flavobacteriales bacterium]|nr:hypothetical protein [Flavobacteriales bacterium]
MNKFSFLYLITCYFLASIFTLNNHIDISHQIIGSLFLITLFGIPHGAIDNIILKSEVKISNLRFYSLYISCILLYIITWFVSPIISFYLFLIISSYHFGESQLANYKISNNNKKLIYLIWGTALMSTLFYYNEIELINLFSLFEDTENLNSLFYHNYFKIVFYVSNILIFLSLIFLQLKNQIKASVFRNELFQLFLLHLTFYLFPVIISFTLYFVFLHSLKVLSQEFNYLNIIYKKLSISKFIILLAPHTLLSLAFLAFFIYLCQNNIINISILLLTVIGISVITLPHSIVMTKFYEKFK